MDDVQRVIIAIRVDKAREDMATAREDLARGRFQSAIARAYYAVFHITGAALLTILSGFLPITHDRVTARPETR
jgi:uncharacterized protein (UPF0332 family)